MGFNESAPTKALNMHSGNVEYAMNQLLIEAQEPASAGELGSSEGAPPALEPAPESEYQTFPEGARNKHLVYITGTCFWGEDSADQYPGVAPISTIVSHEFLENVLRQLEYKSLHQLPGVTAIYITDVYDKTGGSFLHFLKLNHQEVPIGLKKVPHHV